MERDEPQEILQVLLRKNFPCRYFIRAKLNVYILVPFSSLIALASTVLNRSEDSKEFPGGPVDRTWCFYFHRPGLTPNWGIKIPQAAQPK